MLARINLGTRHHTGVGGDELMNGMMDLHWVTAGAVVAIAFFQMVCFDDRGCLSVGRDMSASIFQ